MEKPTDDQCSECHVGGGTASYASAHLELIWNEESLNAIFSTLRKLARGALRDWEDNHQTSPDADLLQAVLDLSDLGKRRVQERVCLENNRRVAEGRDSRSSTNKGADKTALDEGDNNAVHH